MQLTKNQAQKVYAVGGIGRDMLFVLVAMFLMTYIQYTMNLSIAQFTAVSGVVVFARVWDAINDPMMGVVIENKKLKQGKFRPWILLGGCLNFLITLMLFTVRPSGWSFVIFFGIAYIAWGMTYTINDIAYWSLLPNLSKNNDERNALTNLVMVFASLGQFLSGGLIPVIVTGNAVMMYKVVALVISFTFLFFTILTYLGVGQHDQHDESKPHETVSIKQMFKILTGNDQLIIVTIGLLFQTISIELFVALSMNFFYFQFGYGGFHLTLFTIFFGLGTLSALALFPLLTKKFDRITIIIQSVVVSVIGLTLFVSLGLVLPMIEPLLFIAVFLAFFGLSLFYVVIIVLTANVIEYNEYKTGQRNESIIFSVRPFMAKLGAAVQQGLVSIILIGSGVYSYSRSIAQLEQAKALGEVSDITNQANVILNTATPEMLLALRLGMGLIPLILMAIAGFLVAKHYIITEEKYNEILVALGR